MEETKFYVLPKLLYDCKDLAPYMSEEQLRIHHGKHHQAYVNGANSILQKLDKARTEDVELDIKSALKELSFNIGGQGGRLLHSLFWGNMTPAGRSRPKPDGVLSDVLEKEFRSFERFKKEFTQAAISVEGSGWATITFCKQTNRPMIMQIEKGIT